MKSLAEEDSVMVVADIGMVADVVGIGIGCNVVVYIVAGY